MFNEEGGHRKLVFTDKNILEETKNRNGMKK